MSAERTAPREVLLCPDGPVLIPGPVTVEDEQGVKHHSERPVVAVCRCGASSVPPWCDGSHKQVRRRPATAVPSPRHGRELEDY
ncbi:MAG: CDGSH iron-sulfur domain-containing protein [Actinomycetota bacterium]|nr:CDGSH iron-sulfur domain-containing protein [Actinomycetota bacterium]